MALSDYQVSNPNNTESSCAMETLAVRVLCSGAFESPIKRESELLLRKYRWRDPICQAIYKAVMDLPGATPERLRELLPAKLTRLGYPDIDWEEFFTPHHLSNDDALVLFRRMSGSL